MFIELAEQDEQAKPVKVTLFSQMKIKLMQGENQLLFLISKRKIKIEINFFFQNKQSALVNVLNRAKQEVPKEMYRFSLTTKKKVDPLYGAFGPKKDLIGKKATHIKFD